MHIMTMYTRLKVQAYFLLKVHVALEQYAQPYPPINKIDKFVNLSPKYVMSVDNGK